MDTVVFAPYQDVPICALNASCRWKLSELLNADMPITSAKGYPRSWEGLAELIGLMFDRIKLLRNKADPTAALIEYWEDKPDATIGKLLEYLGIMERYDIREDIWPMIKRDGDRYLKQVEEAKLRLEARKPVQDPQVSSGDPVSYKLTVQDVLPSVIQTGAKEEQLVKFDAYVSYSESDMDFVLELARKLELEKGLKLFIKDRDMLLGLVESEAVIKMMHERCERILLVLSQEFLNDPKCEFQTVFAQALQVENNMYARKVIPIIYKPCELPVRLRFIANLNYTKHDMFGSFWNRLYSSITKPIDCGDNTCTLPVPAGTLSSISMSSLMEIDGGHLVPAVNTRKASFQGASIAKGLSPEASQDSGISMSVRSTSSSDFSNVAPQSYEMDKVPNMSLTVRDPIQNHKKKSPLASRKKTFFRWGSGSSSSRDGHTSN